MNQLMWKLLLRDFKMLLRDDMIYPFLNPRTPRPDIELGEIFELVEAVQIDPEQEQLNIRLEVEDESDEVDTEHPPTLNLEIEND